MISFTISSSHNIAAITSSRRFRTAGFWKVLPNNNRVRSAWFRGFTLVELLVVIAIIGVLVALLLPAIQAAREAARRTQCINNLKQVSLAAHNHHETNQSFPFAGILSSSYLGGCPAGKSHAYGWRVRILPFIEEVAVSEELKKLDPYNKAVTSNSPLQLTVIQTYICPSETIPALSKTGRPWMISPQLAGISSYFGSAGATATHPDAFYGCGLCTTAQTNCLCTDQNTGVYGCSAKKGGSGLFSMGPTKIRFKDVTDGTSHTLLLGESRVHLHPVDGDGPPHQWMEPLSVISTVNGINTPPGAAAMNPFGQSYERMTFSSNHPGGAHFGMVDGSAMFLEESIDLFVLSYLGTKAGGETVSGQ